MSLKKVVTVISRMFFIQMKAFSDQRELFWQSISNYRDQDYLAMTIRHIAHRIEKFLLVPGTDGKYRERVRELNNNLNRLLIQWKREVDQSSPDIVWARKIYRECEEYFEKGKKCCLIGKRMQNGKILDPLDLLSIIKERRTVRNWKTDQIEKEHLELLLEAANWAPSSCNRQSLKYLVLSDKQQIKSVAASVKGGHHFFPNAPVLLILIADIRRYQFPEEVFIPFQDAAAAAQNIQLMAHVLGLGCCWASYTSGTGIIKKEKRIRKVIGIPRHYKMAAILAVGKPDMDVCVVSRHDILKILHENMIND